MTDVRETGWRIAETRAALAGEVAGHVRALVEAAVAARGRATLALPGGSTPAPILERLDHAGLPWDRLILTLGDERWVDADHPASNIGQLRRLLTGPAAAAAVVPLVETVATLDADAEAADRRLSALDWPLDLVWLGVGADGHTASLFPGAHYGRAIDRRNPARVMALTPQSLPTEAPFPRLTMPLASLIDARAVMLVATGLEKRALLDEALAAPGRSAYPVARLLEAAPVTIFWAE